MMMLVAYLVPVELEELISIFCLPVEISIYMNDLFKILQRIS